MVEAQGQIATVQRVRGALRQIPGWSNVAMLAHQGTGRIRRTRQLDRYCRELPPQQRCLFVGAGGMTVDGWLCSDLWPVKASTMYLDATKTWPMPSESFGYVACEHMIEHVPYDAALGVLSEAHRVLVRHGVLRVSTPNLDVIRRLPDLNDDPDVHEYVRWSNQVCGSPMERAEPDSAVHALNRAMRAWGHHYLYDEATLRKALTAVGFRDIVRCEPGQSEHPELIGIDRHATEIGETPNRVESLILEATA
jgi:predicted SAM-dependent methyltransferase